jgi:hypothetical protein
MDLTTILEGAPLKTVLGKAAYLIGVGAGGLIAIGVTRDLIHATIRRACPYGCNNADATSYGLLAGGIQLTVAVCFFLWLRRVRRSEGGKVAARLAGFGLVALLGLVAVLAWMHY